MNAERWFEMYGTLPGIFVTAAEVDAALSAAPDDIDTRLSADDAARRAAEAAGAAAAWWQRRLAGEDVPQAHPDADGEISGPDELYAWLWGYQHAAAAPV